MTERRAPACAPYTAQDARCFATLQGPNAVRPAPLGAYPRDGMAARTGVRALHRPRRAVFRDVVGAERRSARPVWRLSSRWDGGAHRRARPTPPEMRGVSRHCRGRTPFGPPRLAPIRAMGWRRAPACAPYIARDAWGPSTLSRPNGVRPAPLGAYPRDGMAARTGVRALHRPRRAVFRDVVGAERRSARPVWRLSSRWDGGAHRRARPTPPEMRGVSRHCRGRTPFGPPRLAPIRAMGWRRAPACAPYIARRVVLLTTVGAERCSARCAPYVTETSKGRAIAR